MRYLFPTGKGYQRKWLGQDVLSGVVIAAVSIPISMGYAQIAGLPAVYGLYGSLLPVILFALLSTSPQFIFGVDAAPAAMIGGVLAGYAINPLITLGAGAIGLVAGLAWQKLPGLRTGLRLQISVLLGHFVGSMVITSLALRIFYGYPWATLAVRIPNALILAAVNTVLLRILLENLSLIHI